MPRYSTWDDEDDDDRDWSADASDDDPVDDDEELEPTYPCPACRRLIHEEAHACPYCGEYLAASDVHAASRRPLWVSAGAFIALLAMLFTILLMLLALLA